MHVNCIKCVSMYQYVHERVNYLPLKSAAFFYLLYDESRYRPVYRATSCNVRGTLWKIARSAIVIIPDHYGGNSPFPWVEFLRHK